MGCASTERTDWASNGYHAEERKISALVEADKIGIGEANAEMLQVSKAYFPNDARLANHWIYAIDLASQARDGKIHAIYTSDKRTIIHHCVFDEEWVLQAPQK